MINSLIKTQSNTENPKQDNSDKKQLFDSHLKSASDYQEEWSFIANANHSTKSRALDNISYNLQYIEFQIKLYNEYQFYLTPRSGKPRPLGRG